MAVEQHFTFPLPIAALDGIGEGDDMVQVTLDRHAAAVLHSELGDALGHIPPVQRLPEILPMYYQGGDVIPAEFDEDEDDMVDAGMPFQGGTPITPGRTVSVEQMAKNMERQLAAEQVASRRGQSVVDGLNRGSGIGSGQR